MKKKAVCIVVTERDRVNMRTAAAVINKDTSTLIRSIVKEKLQELQIPIPEDSNK